VKTSLGAHLQGQGAKFMIQSNTAESIKLCLFDGLCETQIDMQRAGNLWHVHIPEVRAGQRYGYRAHGAWQPEDGLWFDPAKLLVDPYALVLDQRFVYDSKLGIFGEDTAVLVPKAIVQAAPPVCDPEAPRFKRGGLIYEINVRGFSMLHPDVPPPQRGTVAALAHPSIIAHLKKLRVSAIELMPIIAWIDERHLPPLGLTNAWGYNPVVPMALDPGLVPGGIAELRETVAALHAAGIGVILDLVFNHSGESDIAGPLISFRGLDNRAYYAHASNGTLINDSGCGNTLKTAEPSVRKLILDTLRHFVRHCGIDGFRFDLAPVLARTPGFDPKAPIFDAIAVDPWLKDRIMIAEPWDIGPGGYQLGKFPENWLEWNDRYRDDVRRFWRGEGNIGALATRISGSADIFGSCNRSVNFIAAHDGFTLADLVSYEARHNHANGEDNRDGHGENLSWNNGVEGQSDAREVMARRQNDLKALLSTLFSSTGTIMLTAGDEFCHSQKGNNNAYAQDNATSWIDWETRNHELETFVAALADCRNYVMEHFTTLPVMGEWRTLDGVKMTAADWEKPGAPGVCYVSRGQAGDIAMYFNRFTRTVDVQCGKA
jgi:glycogen debranching enzyme